MPDLTTRDAEMNQSSPRPCLVIYVISTLLESRLSETVQHFPAESLNLGSRLTKYLLRDGTAQDATVAVQDKSEGAPNQVPSFFGASQYISPVAAPGGASQDDPDFAGRYEAVWSPRSRPIGSASLRRYQCYSKIRYRRLRANRALAETTCFVG